MLTVSMDVEPGEFAKGEAARCWCRGEAVDCEMDHRLALEFARTLEVATSQPWLGNATTGELLEELKVRAEVSGTLDYKTVDEE